MKLEQQVVSLELAKQLKELGVPQDSHFRWAVVESSINPRNYILLDFNDYMGNFYNPVYTWYSAFTVAELGEMLPKQIHPDGEAYVSAMSYGAYNGGMMWGCNYFSFLNHKTFHSECAETEADARAKMLIWLIENKYIDLKQGNK